MALVPIAILFVLFAKAVLPIAIDASPFASVLVLPIATLSFALVAASKPITTLFTPALLVVTPAPIASDSSAVAPVLFLFAGFLLLMET